MKDNVPGTFEVPGSNYLPKHRFIKTTKDTKAAQRTRRMSLLQKGHFTAETQSTQRLY
jgi:hypothetical protein